MPWVSVSTPKELTDWAMGLLKYELAQQARSWRWIFRGGGE